MKNKIEIAFDIIALVVLVGLLLGGIYIYTHWARFTEYKEPKEAAELSEEEHAKEIVLPESFELGIPFISQAPLGNWNSPFDHACEEAAVLMVHYYLQNESSINPTKAGEEIREIIEFEKQNYGFYEDTSTKETAQLIQDYYDYKVRVDYDISLEDIKKELVQGHPVIIPTAGRMLNNPYFTPPGPIYHMLVIKGFNNTDFITNDPGTSRGADYSYSYETLEKAIHDMGIESNQSAMIVIYP